MKKYKNISSTTLALDCITKTIFIKSQEILQLPRSRDVRYYCGLGKLKLVREQKENVLSLKTKNKTQLPLDEKAPKKGKTFKKQEVIEDNINNKNMEIE